MIDAIAVLDIGKTNKKVRLKCHIHHKRIKPSQISARFVKTNMSISQIAYKLGFTDVEYLSRYFRIEKKRHAL
jgi:AraC-like DNA-binding protein